MNCRDLQAWQIEIQVENLQRTRVLSSTHFLTQLVRCCDTLNAPVPLSIPRHAHALRSNYEYGYATNVL